MIAIHVTRRVLTRECGRLALAFAVYLALHPLWVGADLRSGYQHLVLSAAGSVVRVAQHFPVLDSLEGLEVHNLDFAVVLVFALAIVAPRGRRRRTWAVAAGALPVVFGLHVAAVAAQALLSSADDLAGRDGLQLLVAWERWWLERIRYLLYDFGVQLLPFVLIALATAWNLAPAARSEERPPEPAPSKRPEARRVTRRRRRSPALAVVALLAIAAVWAAARRARESDPGHRAAHAAIGHRLLRAERPDEAVAHYRAAIDGGSRDPEVLFGLATLLHRRGATAEARDLLHRGLDSTADPLWRSRFRRALDASAP